MSNLLRLPKATAGVAALTRAGSPRDSPVPTALPATSQRDIGVTSPEQPPGRRAEPRKVMLVGVLPRLWHGESPQCGFPGIPVLKGAYGRDGERHGQVVIGKRGMVLN